MHRRGHRRVRHPRRVGAGRTQRTGAELRVIGWALERHRQAHPGWRRPRPRVHPMTAASAPDVTDRTDATDEEFADRLRAFDGEAAPESFDATVERVAVALWRSDTEDEFPGADLDRLW